MSRQNTVWSDEIVKECDHNWQPVSFVFESQTLDKDGRPQIKQPDIDNGRVYCVCMECCSHTYIETGWVGYYLGSPDTMEQMVKDAREQEGDT